DGNILGPKIVGESIGISAFWVIFAILIGGGLFGIVGMIVGVPVFAFIYAFIRSLVNRKIEQQKTEKGEE
ncbi:MAG: AI-2E family transporter, partial [Clostridia bacterium]|nr:AI-2E family transporter [Clostridia bacterium]